MPNEAVTTVEPCDPPEVGPPVAVDVALCKACGICVGICAKAVLVSGRGGIPQVERPEECTACRICELHCAEFAISVRVPMRSKAARAEGEQG